MRPNLIFAGLAGLALLVLGSLAGCSSGPACAVDTDCPLGNRCAAGGTCQVVGVATDSGPSDSGPRDGAVTDARTDSGPADAGPADAGSDAGPTCTVMAGSYPLTTVGVMCSGLTAATMTLTADVIAECTFAVQLDAADSGSLAPESGLEANQLGGTLTIGAGTPHCIATFTPTTGAVTVTCDDGCLFTAMLRP